MSYGCNIETRSFQMFISNVSRLLVRLPVQQVLARHHSPIRTPQNTSFSPRLLLWGKSHANQLGEDSNA